MSTRSRLEAKVREHFLAIAVGSAVAKEVRIDRLVVGRIDYDRRSGAKLPR